MSQTIERDHLAREHVHQIPDNLAPAVNPRRRMIDRHSQASMPDGLHGGFPGTGVVGFVGRVKILKHASALQPDYVKIRCQLGRAANCRAPPVAEVARLWSSPYLPTRCFLRSATELWRVRLPVTQCRPAA